MEQQILAHHPQQVIHLGDENADAQRLSMLFPDLTFHMVPGNAPADYFAGLPATRILHVEDTSILLTHGHLYHVRRGTKDLAAAARRNSVQAAFYGHTHIAAAQQEDNLLLLNPGCCCRYLASDERPCSYAVVSVDGSRLEYVLHRQV